MATPAIARRVRRPAPALTALDVASAVVRSLARTRMPIGALSGYMPDAPGVIGLWIDRDGASAIGEAVRRPGDWLAFMASAVSLWEPVMTHLDDSARTQASPLRMFFAAQLGPTIGLAPGDAPQALWDLDEDSELRLSDWLTLHVEVGWWTPPASLRHRIEQVRGEVEARHQAIRAAW